MSNVPVDDITDTMISCYVIFFFFVVVLWCVQGKSSPKGLFFYMLGRCYISFFYVLNNVPFVCNVKVCTAYEILEKNYKI